MRLIDGDALKRKYEDHKRLFCRNRIEFSTLSDKDKARVDELDNCIADILNAPTIEERKVGKWIDKGWNGDRQYQMDGRGNSWHEWQCSECNHITKGAKWNFCPNCGAKMEEGDHS